MGGCCSIMCIFCSDGTIPTQELVSIIKSGNYTIIDARGHDQNAKNGLDKSVSVPAGGSPEESKTFLIEALEKEPLKSSPKDSILLVHCDGGLFAASTRAALGKEGFINAKNAGGWGGLKKLIEETNAAATETTPAL